jgi:hypothetical protein
MGIEQSPFVALLLRAELPSTGVHVTLLVALLVTLLLVIVTGS